MRHSLLCVLAFGTGCSGPDLPDFSKANKVQISWWEGGEKKGMSLDAAQVMPHFITKKLVPNAAAAKAWPVEIVFGFPDGKEVRCTWPSPNNIQIRDVGIVYIEPQFHEACAKAVHKQGGPEDFMTVKAFK